MSNHRFVFMAGLPRSGSTLLANVLAQNPDFHVSPTSGVIDLVMAVRQAWDQNPSFLANPDDTKKLGAMRGVIEGSYSHCDQPYIFDRSRGWPHLFEFLDDAFADVKMVVCVRDIKQIVCSWELLWRQNYLRHDGMSDDQRAQCATRRGRIHYWLRYDQPTGIAIAWLKDLFARGHGDRVHVVDYDQFTGNPRAELDRIHKYLAVPRYAYPSGHVDQSIFENDHHHGSPGLHDVGGVIEHRVFPVDEILGEDQTLLDGLNFWEAL